MNMPHLINAARLAHFLDTQYVAVTVDDDVDDTNATDY